MIKVRRRRRRRRRRWEVTVGALEWCSLTCWEGSAV